MNLFVFPTGSITGNEAAWLLYPPFRALSVPPPPEIPEYDVYLVTLTSTYVSSPAITVAQNSAAVFTLSVYDQNQNPVSVAGKSLSFIAYLQTDTTTVVFTKTSASGSIVIGGTSSNQATVTLTSSDTANYEPLQYSMWDLTDQNVLAYGGFQIVPAGV